MKNIILTAILLFMTSMAQAEVQGKEVTYSANGTLLKGYIAYDDAIQGKRPGVLVVHEWWGLDDYARNRARMLAQSGYIALALDMYGEGKQAHHPDDAGKFAGELAKNLPLAKTRFEAAATKKRGREKYRRAGLLFRRERGVADGSPGRRFERRGQFSWQSGDSASRATG